MFTRVKGVDDSIVVAYQLSHRMITMVQHVSATTRSNTAQCALAVKMWPRESRITQHCYIIVFISENIYIPGDCDIVMSLESLFHLVS